MPERGWRQHDKLGSKCARCWLGLRGVRGKPVKDRAIMCLVEDSNRKGKEKVMSKPRLKDHILICGWSDATRIVVEQLHSEDVEELQHIVIIDEKITHCPVDDPFVSFINGDPTEDETLERAGVSDARTAIILTDWSLPDPSLRDSKTALVTLAVESMNSEVYTCAELMKAESKRHLERAGVDEPICVSDMSQRMLVMAALNHGLSRLFDDLLTFNEGSEIYCTPVPNAYVGNGFRELVSDLSAEKEIIVMAVKRGDDLFTNPGGHFVLEEGDRLYLLAEEYPHWIQEYQGAKAREKRAEKTAKASDLGGVAKKTRE